MRGVHLLADPPDTPQPVGPGCQHKIRLGDHVDHLVIRQKIAGIEIDPARPVPDNDLAHRKAGQDILTVLQKPLLYAPFVIVEDHPVRAQQTHHLVKAVALPADIGVMRH